MCCNQQNATSCAGDEQDREMNRNQSQSEVVAMQKSVHERVKANSHCEFLWADVTHSFGIFTSLPQNFFFYAAEESFQLKLEWLTARRSAIHLTIKLLANLRHQRINSDPLWHLPLLKVIKGNSFTPQRVKEEEVVEAGLRCCSSESNNWKRHAEIFSIDRMGRILIMLSLSSRDDAGREKEMLITILMSQSHRCRWLFTYYGRHSENVTTQTLSEILLRLLVLLLLLLLLQQELASAIVEYMKKCNH